AGKMKAQVRAGKWTLRADAFRFDNPKQIRYAEGAKPAAEEELVAFRARPDFRIVEIVGAPSIDISQTTFPEKWRELPVYRWDTATSFQIEERMRGMGDQKPAGLRIARELWLDENGSGLTFRDEITGAMQQIWRLDAAEGQDLGSVRSDGKGQLITRNPQNGASGVEIRTRNLNLEATGRTTRASALSATGWRSDADGVNVTLNLPPGWRLFALFGADWVQGDWLTAWTLLDLFLLLIFSLAVFRLWGFLPGLLAFVAFGLAYHEPGAPRYLWLILLVPLALQRVVPEGWAKRAVEIGKWIAIGAFVLVLVPFIARQVQQALYPQLESHTVNLATATVETVQGQISAQQEDSASAEGREKLNRKLASIIIPRVEFKDATIREAVEFLKHKSIDLDTMETDPSRKGVNIILRLEGGAAVPEEPAIPGLPSNPSDARITVSLTSVPLGEALRYVTDMANLKYKVDPYAISIIPRSANTDSLITKEYIVRPGFISRVAGGGDTTKDGSSIAGRMDAKEFLTASGVNFPQGATATFIPGSNRLLIRNSEENLDLIDTLVEADVGAVPPIPGLPAPEAPADATRGQRAVALRKTIAGENLSYDAKARIQTGPGVPEWKWRAVSFGWNGPVQASQRVKPVLIPLALERVLTVLRVVLLLTLAGVLLGVRRISGSVFGGKAKGAAIVLLAGFASDSLRAEPAIPDPATLDKLRERLLEVSDAYPNAADIPSVALTLTNRKIVIDAEMHAAIRTAVPLPGKLPAWSPLTVLVDDKPEVALRRDDGYLWLVLPEGVHHVRVEGSLANLTEWEWTFLLKPRLVKIDAPDWNYSGVRPSGVPEPQVFFTLKQKTAQGQISYDRQDLQTIVAIDRNIELGLIWQVHTKVTRLSPIGKAVALRMPLLPGENVLTSNTIVKDGFIDVRLGAQEESFAWESGLAVVDQLKLATRAADTWVERWHLVASPVWNVTISGLAPVFEQSRSDLIPVWQPWPGENVDLALSRPEAIAGATVTVTRGTHTINLGRRQRVSTLDLSLRCSLGEDFPVTLPADAEISTLTHDGRNIPVRKDGNNLIIPLRPGDQSMLIGWKINMPLGFRAEAEQVRLPVESANIQTVINVPDDRWVLWTAGPRRGPAVRFWGILVCSLLSAAALGRLAHSPIHMVSWMLLVIGLTQVPLPAALTVVGWLFLLSWRGSEAFKRLGNLSYNSLQVLLVALTATALGILITAVGEGLLGNPEMFIIGNDSTRTELHWFQARTGNLLPRPDCFSISIWWYRFFMLVWALWLAASLIRWLRLGWQNFSSGGFFRRKPKPQPTPPPLPLKP
ncbi:MAG TPA: hypothetical protein VFD27_14725, partial [Chthoniobacteraceae bacterium]|nr:hypothetical protein [Chthoniobacteraceae bacterium]